MTETIAGAERIEIDGSILEGGGQILRNAISLASVTNRSIIVHRIRAGRSKPGLSNQHVAGLKLASDLTNGLLVGCSVSSMDLSFIPQHIKSGSFSADSKTAGSIALMMQVAVPVLAYASSSSTLELRGGTDASFAPPIDYMNEVTAYYYSKMGLNFHSEILERGYYPQGGGHVKVFIEPLKTGFLPLNMIEVGDISRIYGSAFTAGKVPTHVAEEIRSMAFRLFRSHFPKCPVRIETFRAPDNRVRGSASAFLFIIETSTGCRLAASGLGQPRGPSMDELVTNAVSELSESFKYGSCFDSHMQDQLVLPMALAAGKSIIRTGPLTLHTQSAIYVAESMLPVKFETEELANGAVLLSCNGASLLPNSTYL